MKLVGLSFFGFFCFTSVILATDVYISDSGPALRPMRNELASRPMARVGTYNRFLLPSANDKKMPFETANMVYDPVTPFIPDGTVVTKSMFLPPTAEITYVKPDDFFSRVWRTISKPFQRAKSPVILLLDTSK